MNDYLTISEVAKLTNRSYQNISQRTKTSLKKYVVEINGRKMLKRDVLSEFSIPSDEEVFKDEIKAENKSVLNDNSTPLHQSKEDELNELIRELRAEVKKKDEIIILKDEQLQKQTEQIIDLSNRVVELFENSQKLQIQTSYLLGHDTTRGVCRDTTDLYVEDEASPMDEHTPRARDEISENKPSKIKGFFSRFFK